MINGIKSNQTSESISTIKGSAPYRVVVIDSTGLAADIGLGTAGNILTSNGASTLPSFQAGGGGGAVASVNTRTGAVTLVGTDIPVFVASGASHAAGAVPDPGVTAGATKFLREDATWAVPAGAGGVTTVNTRSGAVTLVATDIPVFIASGASHAVGTVPDPGVTAGTTKFLREDATWGVPAYPVASVNTRTGSITLLGTDIPAFVASGASHAAGAVPDPGVTAGATKFLREDATWAVPAGAGGVTTVNTRSGAVTLVATDIPVFIASGASHAVGVVPDPGVTAGATKFLREDATWAVPAGGGGGGGTGTALKRVILKDVRTNGTGGGIAPSTNAWFTRTLQTLELDEIGTVSLSSNQFTLPAGTYDIDAALIFVTLNRFAVRLFNVTDSAEVLKGTTGYAGAAVYASPTGHIKGTFTIAGTKTFRIEAISAAPNSANDNGIASVDASFGTEVYTIVELTQRAAPSAGGTAMTQTKRLILKEVLPSGTDGGPPGSLGVWEIRAINTVDVDEIGGISISGNQFTLPAGRYYVNIEVPFYAVNNAQARLYNVTDSAISILGTSTFGGATTAAVTLSTITGILTLTGSKTFKIESFATSDTGNAQRGKNASTGGNEVYVVAVIDKMTDVAPGGNAEIPYFADARPASAGAIDDEFDGSALSGSWTWVNQGALTYVVHDSAIEAQAADSASGEQLLVRAMPAGDWTISAKVIAGNVLNYPGVGLTVRDSAAGTFTTWGFTGHNTIQHNNFTNPTTFAGAALATGVLTKYLYLRIAKVGTNFSFYYSDNGKLWLLAGTEATTAFMAAPNQVGLWFRGTATAFPCRVEWFRQT